MEDGQKAAELIQGRFAEAVLGAGAYRSQHWVELRAEALVEVCGWLRDEPATAFDFLVDVTAVHYPDDAQPMEAVYHVYSYSRNDRLRLKVRTASLGPLPTLSHIWKSAEWNERETYDMFGIRFEGHPDLRRILMPDDYSDFPLRKELPLFRA